MKATPMPVDHFEMAPLDEFVVTFKDHTVPIYKELLKVNWRVWIKDNGNPPYYNRKPKLLIDHFRPKDVQVELESVNVKSGYRLVFNDDPDWEKP
jgi:hypothetical protein